MFYLLYYNYHIHISTRISIARIFFFFYRHSWSPENDTRIMTLFVDPQTFALAPA